MKLAAIDIGSNSVRYLAVEVRSGEMRYLASGTSVTRLTEGIGEGRFRVKAQALTRTRTAVMKHLESVEALGVSRADCVFFGTESLRSASNADKVREELESATGFPLEVLSGAEEGRFSAAGASLSGMEGDMVFDLGGGSLEIQSPESVVSYPLGAVRIKGLLGEDRQEIDRFVRKYLEQGVRGHPDHLIGVGGTSSSIAMMLAEIPVESYHPSRIHGREIGLEELQGLVGRLRPLDLIARGRMTGLEPRRADIVVSGLLVIETLLLHLRLDRYRHSECDLLWGRLEELARARKILIKSVSFPPPGDFPQKAGQEAFQTL